MSNQQDEPDTGIADDQLPEDLQPTDDNPLAKPLGDEDAKSPEDLDVFGGKSPEQSDDDSGETDDTDDSED
jgi:hypothetical protein